MVFIQFFTIFVVLFFAASALAIFLYGRFAKSAQGKFSQSIDTTEGFTILDKKVEELSNEHHGLGVHEDALALIRSNFDAFASRVVTTSLAGRSLDLMYYIWNDDLTGRLLLHEVLEAAERGVRVRLLLDDINAQGRDPAYAALDQHENIEIRMFNPGRARANGLRRGIEMVLRALFVTRRMHNKAYIVDGRVAFVGGRNIGDAYFDAGESSNFRDLDVMMIGPAVRDVSDIFDRYWNSAVALPIHKLALPIKSHDLKDWKKRLHAFRQKEPVKSYIEYIHCEVPFEYFLRVGVMLFKADKVHVLADPPEKALRLDAQNWLMRALFPLLEKTKESLQLTSPYFVPGTIGARMLIDLAHRNIDVKVLTNSLAATDVSVVHGGYVCYRKSLLKAGVKLYELKPDAGTRNKFKFRILGLGRSRLHTKAFLIDKKTGFVGSFNFDPRSASLNTEMGILFECGAIAAYMDMLFEEEITAEMSYKVLLTDVERLAWSHVKDGQLLYEKNEPQSTFLLRLFVKVISWLPAIKSQL